MLAINIRWLDTNFKRHQHCIEFIEIKGTHSGENLAEIVLTALKRFKCCHRLFTITGDNASNNDTLCAYLHELLLKEYDDYLEEFPIRDQTMRFQGSASRIRCFAHILNLIVKAILAELGSSTQKQASEYLDRAAITIAKKERSRLSLPGAQGVIAKLRIIILWIHRSTSRIQDWYAQDGVSKLPNYDVDTRWNFTLRMIDDAFDCRAAINDSCQAIDTLRDIKLGNEEWNALERIRSVLRPFKKFTEYVSRDQPSIQMLARMYEEIGTILHQIANKEGDFGRLDSGLVSAVRKGIKVFDKYYGLMSEHDLYYVASVLDPRVKTKWIQDNVPNPTAVIDRIRTFLKATYPLPDTPLPDNIQESFQTLEYQFLEPYLQSTDSPQEHDINSYLDSPRVRYNRRKTDDQTQWILS
jgi:hypothetical protein